MNLLKRGLLSTRLRELEIPALAMEPNRDQPDAGPGVPPPMQEPQLGRTGRELEEAESDAEAARSGHHPEPFRAG